ncbi:MAG: hypothetical protein PGN13_16085 [Patulibacter minatonensis]
MRVRIYDEGFGALFLVQLENGEQFSWRTAEEMPALMADLRRRFGRLEEWPPDPEEGPAPGRRVDDAGAWFVV